MCKTSLVLHVHHHEVLFRRHLRRRRFVHPHPAVVQEQRGLHAVRIQDAIALAGIRRQLQHAHAEAVEGLGVGLAVEVVFDVDVHGQRREGLLRE